VSLKKHLGFPEMKTGKYTLETKRMEVYDMLVLSSLMKLEDSSVL
jgi:hypothetical protein